MQRLRRTGATSAVLAILAVPTLVGCSDDNKAPAAQASTPSSTASTAGSTGTATTSATPSLPVPDGVELSPEGSQLHVGETATVAYQLPHDEVGVLDIRVTRLERTTIKKSFVGWDLDAGQKGSNPYFVRATITNRGTTDLGAKRVPLYIVDANNTLVEATSFASAFTACQPDAFPKSFKPGKKVKVCLVYLAPKKGKLTAVSFRPTQEFDPITWTGELKSPKPPKKHKGKPKGGS